MDRLAQKADERNILYEGQKFEEDDYGYSIENPIMTSTIQASDLYLQSLRTEKGEPFTWNRRGSTSLDELYSVKNVIIDIYDLYLNNQEYKTIYICPYGHSSTNVPKGMIYKNEDK